MAGPFDDLIPVPTAPPPDDTAFPSEGTQIAAGPALTPEVNPDYAKAVVAGAALPPPGEIGAPRTAPAPAPNPFPAPPAPDSLASAEPAAGNPPPQTAPAPAANPFGDLIPAQPNQPAPAPAAPGGNAFADLVPAQTPASVIQAPWSMDYQQADIDRTRDVAKGLVSASKGIIGTIQNLAALQAGQIADAAQSGDPNIGKYRDELIKPRPGDKLLAEGQAEAPQTMVGQAAGIIPYLPFFEAGPLMMGLQTWQEKLQSLKDGPEPVDDKTAQKVGVTQGALMAALAFVPGGKALEKGALPFVKNLVSGAAKMSAFAVTQYGLGKEAGEKFLSDAGYKQRAAAEAPNLTGAEQAALSMAVQHVGMTGAHALINKFMPPAPAMTGQPPQPQPIPNVPPAPDVTFANKETGIPEELQQKPYDIDAEMAKQGLVIAQKPAPSKAPAAASNQPEVPSNAQQAPSIATNAAPTGPVAMSFDRNALDFKVKDAAGKVVQAFKDGEEAANFVKENNDKLPKGNIEAPAPSPFADLIPSGKTAEEPAPVAAAARDTKPVVSTEPPVAETQKLKPGLLAPEQTELTDMAQRLKTQVKPQDEAKYPILNWLKQSGGVDPNSEFGKGMRDNGITNQSPVPGIFTEPRFVASTNKWLGKNTLEGKSPNDLPEHIRNLLPVGDPNEGMNLDAAQEAIRNEVHRAGAGRFAEDPALHDLSAELQQRGIETTGKSPDDIARAIIKGRQKEARALAKSLGAQLTPEEIRTVASLFHSGYDKPGYDMQDALDDVLERRAHQAYNEAGPRHDEEHEDIPWGDIAEARQAPEVIETVSGGAGTPDRQHEAAAEENAQRPPGPSASDAAPAEPGSRASTASERGAAEQEPLKEIADAAKAKEAPIPMALPFGGLREDSAADIARRKADERLKGSAGQKSVDDLGLFGEGRAKGQQDIFERTPAEKEKAAEIVEAVKTAKPAEKPTGTEPTSGEEIKDFGEKIAGAKKEKWQEYRKAMSQELPADYKDITMSKHFPEPDYEDLMQRGVDMKALAAVKAMRDEIPAKPRQPYKLKRWGEQVKTLRDFSNDLLTKKHDADYVIDKMKSVPALYAMAQRIEMYHDLGYPDFTKADGWNLSSGSYTVFKGVRHENPVDKWLVRGPNGWPSEGFDSRAEAMTFLREKIAAAQPEARKTKLDIYRVTKTGDIVIGKKVGPGKFIDLQTGFKKVGEARAYLRDNEKDLLTLLEKKKTVLPERRGINEPRVGTDYRSGDNVSPEKFSGDFGFRGVQFGNYVEQGRRPRDLNNAFDALHDMANLVNIPPQAISLNGELGLAFGARGSGGVNPAAAHYEPDHVVINLTKNNGAGSLGHEWWHALDNYFGKKAGRDFFTNSLFAKSGTTPGEAVPQEVTDAFKGVMQSIYESGLQKRSSELDKTRSKDYWSTPIEMSARAYERYLIDKAKEQGQSNDYLANITSEAGHKALEEMAGEPQAYPYPTTEEMKTIGPAFDKLFKALSENKEPQNIFRRFMSDTEGSILFGGPIKKGDDAAAADRVNLSTALANAIPDNAKEFVQEATREVLNFATPMETGSNRARAAAKDFANKLRWGQWNGSRLFNYLKTNFKPEELAGMWNAMDETSVHVQTMENNLAAKAMDEHVRAQHEMLNVPEHEKKPLQPDEITAIQQKARADATADAEAKGIGIFKLPPAQREILKAMSDWAQESWSQAKELGMVEGEGLPFWTPRMAAMIGDDGKWGAARMGSETGPPQINPVGRNLRTSSPNLKQRKYLTAGETEGAMKKLFDDGGTGEDVALVRDIRTMPLAMTRLNQAIAGRALINQIKEMSAGTGGETVLDIPSEGYFTMDHPAFQTYRPKLEKDEDGKFQQVKDAEGNPQFEKVPIYVSKEFEGPLNAVLSQQSGAVYKGLMALKGKAMGMIMYSPLIHNAVEWGRALPAMPGKVATFRIYFDGNKAKNDPAQMREAIDAGLVPIGHRYFNQDISSIMEEPNLTPGRSWTAKLLGGLTGAVNEKAGVAVKTAIDDLGDLWHNKLLWDRVGDLQMGLYKGLREEAIKQGADPKSASAEAAHLANRFAGALPMESMGNLARKMANVGMFSRSFTVGNLGVMKDMLVGLPSDVKAQLLRDAGPDAAAAASSRTRRRAQAAFAMDIALMYAGNSIMQDVLDHFKRDKSWSDIAGGYVDRLGKLLSTHKDSPWDLLNVPADLQALSSTSSNEPGKENRILFSKDPKTGTAYYMRLPTGKIGEEFMGWLTTPLDMMRRKSSTIVSPLVDTYKNEDYFGHPVYDADARGIGGAAKNLGQVVMHFMEGQIPEESINSAYQLLTGKGSQTLNTMKTVGPLVGVTFSKGYPGGPEAGIIAATAKRHEAAVSAAIPQIKAAVEGGDIKKATDIMTNIGMAPKDQKSLVRHYLNPAGKVNVRSMRNFERTASPEEKDLMQQQMKQK